MSTHVSAPEPFDNAGKEAATEDATYQHPFPAAPQSKGLARLRWLGSWYTLPSVSPLLWESRREKRTRSLRGKRGRY